MVICFRTKSEHKDTIFTGNSQETWSEYAAFIMGGAMEN